MTKKISALLLGLSLISGCALLNPTSTKSASLIVYPSVRGGNLATKAEITPNTTETINHVRVELFTVNGSNVESPVLNSSSQPIVADVLNADLAKPIQFTRLKAETHYRVKAFAYKAAGTNASDLISVDASSSTDILMGTEAESWPV